MSAALERQGSADPALGVHFEERDLRREFGVAYDEYAARVPAVIPRPRRLVRA